HTNRPMPALGSIKVAPPGSLSGRDTPQAHTHTHTHTEPSQTTPTTHTHTHARWPTTTQQAHNSPRTLTDNAIVSSTCQSCQSCRMIGQFLPVNHVNHVNHVA